MLQSIFAKTAYIKNRWLDNVRVTIQDQHIVAITDNAQQQHNDYVVDTLLPALASLHSHAFQRAMAGMTEYRSRAHDDFWSWRTRMYRFVQHLEPDHIQAIAALAYMEMLEAGYAAVGEFHYLHHQPNGKTYRNRAELSQQIFTAAKTTGIGLTHLPVLYSQGGLTQPLEANQLRFGNTIDTFFSLIEAINHSASTMPDDTVIGVAPHSLRAVSKTDLRLIAEAFTSAPIHIHIAEQPKEVSDVRHYYGDTPVAWLLNHVDVNKQWCLVHATHMTAQETIALANSGAVAGLCPITEANLGDGTFNGAAYLAAGGKFGIGSDSNIRISMLEELRMLEYSQRLRDCVRNVMTIEGSVGTTLYTQCAAGSAQALARPSGQIAIDYLADLVAINRDHPSLLALTNDQLFDGLCFVAPDPVITDVWSAGRHPVQQGRHIQRDHIMQNYRCVMSQLIEKT